MTRPLLLLAAIVALLVEQRVALPQTLVAGGGPAKSDCYGEWLAPAPNRGATRVDCQDGDPSCDLDRLRNGACAMAVGVCLHQSNVARCTPSTVERVTVHATPRRIRAGLPVPAPTLPPVPVNAATCGSDAVIRLPLKTTRSGRLRPSKRVTLRLQTTVRRKPRRDDDRLRLRCVPNTGAGSCGSNPAGGPAELRLVTAGSGTDLDLGWTGNAHSLSIVANATLRVCLQGCDATVNPRCTARAPKTGSVNGAIFGAPLPLLAASVPICVVSRLVAPPLADLAADVASGAATGTLSLTSEVYRTSATRLCPRCSASVPGDAGICDGGVRQGRGCVTDAVVQVPVAAGDPSYALSADCPPAGSPAGSVALSVPVTTGLATLAGPHPCGAAQDDACGGACGALCTGGTCATTENGQCIDARGGTSQLCCESDPERACFATAGGAPIVRLGSATAPAPAFGDPTYPKVGGLVFAGTFCAPASGSSLVDSLVGLPGPGALLLPMAAAWLP